MVAEGLTLLERADNWDKIAFAASGAGVGAGTGADPDDDAAEFEAGVEMGGVALFVKEANASKMLVLS